MTLIRWINDNTKDSKIVVEFGSMFFDKLNYVHDSCKKKIGIEIHQPYIELARCPDCIKIQGNVLDFENLISSDDMDCAMIIDVLEHFEKSVAIELINKIKSRFNKIILMIPEGNHPQTKDVFNMGADEYQTHRSTWYENDIKALGFNKIEVNKNFHHEAGKDSGCIFAVWKKHE